MSTLHTTDASKTVNRIIGIYPKSEEHVIRTRLAQAFRYIITQRLIPRADGSGRIAAVEICKATPRTREYIEQGESEGKTLLEAMNDGELEGMQHFDQVIERMIRSKVITREDGLAFATNPSNLLLRLSGLGTSDDMLSRREERNYIPRAVDSLARARADIVETIRTETLKGREMIASCPQCSMSLSFDDDRLPTEPFNVLCPRCRQSVTIMPPPKEEPRLPGTAGVLDAVATGSQAEKDPIAALAELLLSNLKRHAAAILRRKQMAAPPRACFALTTRRAESGCARRSTPPATRSFQPTSPRKPSRYFTTRALK